MKLHNLFMVISSASFINEECLYRPACYLLLMNFVEWRTTFSSGESGNMINSKAFSSKMTQLDAAFFHHRPFYFLSCCKAVQRKEWCAGIFIQFKQFFCSLTFNDDRKMCFFFVWTWKRTLKYLHRDNLLIKFIFPPLASKSCLKQLQSVAFFDSFLITSGCVT